jgi:hypothetical protein
MIKWDRQESLMVSSAPVELLQRALELDTDSLCAELEPAFEVPALFESRGTRRVRETAVIMAVKVESATLTLRLRNAADVTLSMMVERGRITVWRVDGVLDALQFLFEGFGDEIYVQVGGSALSHLVQHAPFDGTMRRLLDLFSDAGHLPKVGSGSTTLGPRRDDV